MVADNGQSGCHPCHAVTQFSWACQGWLLWTNLHWGEVVDETIACNWRTLPHKFGISSGLDLVKFIIHFKD